MKINETGGKSTSLTKRYIDETNYIYKVITQKNVAILFIKKAIYERT